MKERVSLIGGTLFYRSRDFKSGFPKPGFPFGLSSVIIGVRLVTGAILMEKNSLAGGRFLLVTILNVVITVFELLGGLLSGSLSLLSDAFHNLGDALSVILSYVAHRIGGRRQTRSNTFGYRRAEILTALLNAAS